MELSEELKSLLIDTARQLISQKGYREEELPTATTIATKLNQLGYYPTKVAIILPKRA